MRLPAPPSPLAQGYTCFPQPLEFASRGRAHSARPRQTARMSISYGWQAEFETAAFGSLAVMIPLLERMGVQGIIDGHLPIDPQAEFRGCTSFTSESSPGLHRCSTFRLSLSVSLPCRSRKQETERERQKNP